MYKNVGRKIQGFAIGFCIIGITFFIIYVFNFLVMEIFLQILVSFLGSLGIWLNSLLIYAFGQLVENVYIIAKKIDPDSYTKIETSPEIENNHL